MYKFYYLEDMTQEDLNNLALERNTLQQENKQLEEVIDEVRELLKGCIEKYGVHNMNTKDFDDLLKILDKAKETIK